MSLTGADLVHHGLITVPRRNFPGIYWLRLLRQEGGHVATVTEVPGNPGFSVANGIDGILDLLGETFEVDTDSLMLYVMWPPGSPGTSSEGQYFRPHLSAVDEVWPQVSFSEIEAIVGEFLLQLPTHENLYSQVRMAGGGVWQKIYQPIFKAVPTRDIPVPHCPSRCRYFNRFQEIEARLRDELVDHEECERQAGKEFLDSLSPSDRRHCGFHHARWNQIADESVRIIEELGPAESEIYLEEASHSKLQEVDRGWLDSLFVDPIDIAGGSFTNGQHRGCALRFSGAERVALVVGDELLGEEEILWNYVGGG